MEQFSRIVVRNSAAGMVAQFLIKLLSFGFSILIVRNLGANAFGQYSAVIAFSAIFLFIADMGLAPYTVREVARLRDKPEAHRQISELYANMFGLRLVLAIVSTLVALGAAFATGRSLELIGAIALSNLGLLMWALHGTTSAVLSGYERLDMTSGVTVINQFAFVIVGAVVLYLGLGYYGLIIASLIGTALMTLASWRLMGRMGVHFGPILMRSWITLLRASLPFGIMTLALNLSYHFDSVLLNVTRGDVETGYYNAAYNLVFSAVVISNVVNTALYPSLSRQSINDATRLPAIYERALRYLMVLSFPIAIGIFVTAPQLVPLLFKAQYLPSVPALQILIWVVPLMFASEFLGYVVIVAGHERRVARAIFASTAVNVALNLFFVPRYGFLAAATMTVLTELVLVLQYLWILRRSLPLSQWGRFLIRPFVAAIIMGVVVLVLRDLPFFLEGAVGAAIYFGLLLLFRVIGRDELTFVRNLKRNPPGEVSA